MIMAHFFGSVNGQSRNEASRLGSKRSGLSVVAASWQGAVEVSLNHNERTGIDQCCVSLRPWHGAGTHISLYRGPVGDYQPVGDPLVDAADRLVSAIRAGKNDVGALEEVEQLVKSARGVPTTAEPDATAGPVG